MSSNVTLVARTVACCLVIASCDDAPRASEHVEAPSADDTARPSAPAVSSSDTLPLGAHRADELADAAHAVVAFLRGEVPFDRIRVADTVAFYMSPEGAGPPRIVTRATLRDPRSWTIRGPAPRPGRPGIRYSFAPPPRVQWELTTRVGRHFKCLDYPLSSVSKELARFPHVGIRLAYDTGCLQTHNFTLVFHPTEKPPTLIAAVYDQWEW